MARDTHLPLSRLPVSAGKLSHHRLEDVKQAFSACDMSKAPFNSVVLWYNQLLRLDIVDR